METWQGAQQLAFSSHAIALCVHVYFSIKIPMCVWATAHVCCGFWCCMPLCSQKCKICLWTLSMYMCVREWGAIMQSFPQWLKANILTLLKGSDSTHFLYNFTSPSSYYLTFFNSPSLPFCLHTSSIKSHSLQFSFLGVEFQNYYIVIYLFGHMNTFVWIFSSFFCLQNKQFFSFYCVQLIQSGDHQDHEWNGNVLFSLIHLPLCQHNFGNKMLNFCSFIKINK